MAYGFGATLGTTTTDRIVYPANVTPTIAYTILIWSRRNGSGGNAFGRLYDLGGQDGPFNGFNRESSVSYAINRAYTGGLPLPGWTGTPQPTISVWHPFIVRLDASSSANDPLMNDEAAMTVTELSAPSGTGVLTAGSLCIGNRTAAQDRVWDGLLAEFARWNRLLTDDEVAALGKGYSPMYFLNGLINYAPLIRNTIDRITGEVLTVTGALVHPHPRMIYPGRAGKSLRLSN